MDKAKEYYSRGKHRTVTAKETEIIYKDTVPSNNKRFICPECGEYVAFVRRFKYNSYFKHCKANNATKSCDLRSTTQGDFSIYERVGLPLYLKRYSDNKFELFVGFYCLNQKLMNIAKRDKFNIAIIPLNGDKKNSNMYLINEYNFSQDSTTLKKIDFIAQKYKIEYPSISAEKLLIKRWGKEIDGLSDRGTLFTYSEKGGRRIKINDEITTNTEYYYLNKNAHEFTKNKNVDCEYCGEISLNSNFKTIIYNVYKISFKAHNEEQFDRLHFFCRDKFKVSLIYKPSTLIPVWPPAIQKDNQITYFKYVNEALYILESDERNAKIFLHKDYLIDELKGQILEVPPLKAESDYKKYLMKIPITADSVAVNINERYNSISFSLKHCTGNIKEYRNSIQIKDNNNKLIISGIYTELPLNRKIKIASNTKIDILHLKKNQMYKYYRIKNEKDYSIDHIDFGDDIVAIYGMESSPILSYIKEQKKQQLGFNDELLYNSLRNLGGPLIPPPIWVMSLLRLLTTNSKTFSLIKNFINTNEMPVKAAMILKRAYDLIKDGVICEE